MKGSVLFVIIMLLALWSLITYNPHSYRANRTKAPDYSGLEWIIEKELSRLQRYHGATALRVTEDTVSIYRDDRWIVVARKEEN